MALTKVSGNILDPGINVAGVVTATGFDGPFSGGTDGNFTGNVSIGGTLRVAGVSTFNSNVDFVSTDAGSAAGPELKLYRNSASPADADYLGQLKFAGENDNDEQINYAKITGKILDASDGNEDGILEFSHIKAGSQTITGRWRSDSLQLLNSTNLSVAGSVDVNDTTDSTSKTSGALKVDGGVGIVKNLYVGGNLVVEGTRTEVKSASLEITDKTIGISSTASPSDTTADGAGIVVYGATDKKLTWENSSDSWLTSEHIKVPDNKRIYVGTGTDLSLYHDTNHSYIADTGTGQLRILSNLLHVRNTSDNASIAKFTTGAEVKLYFNANEKLATSDTGITVTGEVAASQDYPNYRPTLDFNFAAVKKLDSRITYQRTGPASYTDEFGKVVLVGANTPRFDHDLDTGESKGLLIEESRTNLFPYGTTPGDNWSGAKAASTWTENTTEVKAPDGTYTATKWEFTGVDPYLYHQGTLSANTTYTMSIWVKAGTNMSGDVLQARMGASPYSTNANSTLSTDGSWKRLTFTKTVGGSNETNVNIGFEPQTNPSGNPAAGDSIYIWGAQLEVGGYVTSFIPTNGETVTRGAETVTMEGEEFSDFYNQEEGTLVLSASYIGDIRGSAIVVIDDTSNESEYTEVGYRAGGGGSGAVASYIRTDAGNDQYFKQYQSSATQGNEFKVALAYKDDDYASSVNGQTVDTDTSGTTSKVYDRLRFSDVDANGVVGYGHYRRFMYYPKRLPNNQVVTLTS